MKTMVANLGFVLQTSGVVTLLAVIPGFIYNEQTALISFFITASIFLVAGFAMNSLSQKKDLDFKSSCVLISIVFLVLGVIGAVPYLYTGVFSSPSVGTRIVNSVFESISGFTTTGLSMIGDVDSLPKSLIFYRALTQWIGGIGIVFIILAFFNSNGALDKLGKAIGFTRLTSNIQNSYIRIFGIYAVYSIIFFVLLYAFGLRNWVTNISLVFSGISTGGFSPVNDLAAVTAFPIKLILALLMLVGATAFMVHYRLFTGKFKKALNLEFAALIVGVVVFTFFFALMTRLDIMTSFFQVASASSTAGYSLVDLSVLASNAKILLSILMFVGGMAYSTAGGLKIINILVFLKSVPWLIRGIVNGRTGALELSGKEYQPFDIITPLIVMFMSIVLIVGFALAFTSYGFSMADSVFVLISALSDTGLDTGIVNSALPVLLKLVLMLLMIVGRIGLIALLVALIPGTKKGSAKPVEAPAG